MCGLAGYLRMKYDTPPYKQQMDIARTLVVLSQLRGFDSAGTAMFFKQVPTKTSKKNGMRWGWMSGKNLYSPYSSFVESWRHIWNRWNTGNRGAGYEDPAAYAALCHARAATHGNVTKENAHPFSFGNNRFIGMHNGTLHAHLKMYEELQEFEPLPKTTEPPEHFKDVDKLTDSEVALYCIYRWGIEAVYPYLEGAWAFVWWSQDDQMIHFIRNHQRTLFFVPSSSKDTLFWSSEQSMLEFAFKREAKHGHNELTMHPPVAFEPHIHYAVNAVRPPAITHANRKDFWHIKDDLLGLRGKKSSGSGYSQDDWVYPVGPYMGYDNSEDYDRYYNDKDKPKTVTKPKPKIVETRRRFPPVKGEGKLMYSVKQLRLIPRDEWEKEQGDSYLRSEEDGEKIKDYFKDNPGICCWCSKPITDDLKEGSLELKDNGNVCGECANDIDVVHNIIEFYPQAGDSREWIQRYIDLDDAREAEAKKAS